MGVDPRRVALEVVRAAVAIALLHAMMAELPPPGETTADNGGGGGGGGGVLGGEGRGGGGGAREGRILATAAHFPLPDNPRMPPSVPPPFSFPLNHFPPSAGLPPLELARSGGAGGSQGGVGRVSGECHVAEGQRVRADGGSDVRQEWQRAEANDTCESIAANFSLTASCLDPSQPCTTDLLSLNPGLDCSSSSSNYPLPTGLSICVKRSTPMVPLCRETVRVQGARSVTCASLLAKVKFPPSALELYRMNPGIYCHRLLPPSKDSGFPGSEVCVRLRAGMTMGSCPRSELYLATDNDSGLVSLLGFVSAPCAASDAAKRSESPDDTADDTVREWAMPQGKNLTLHVLADNTYGAKCLDGSPPGYFLRRGSGAGKEAWHIFLPGGGWCATAEDCAARATTAMGSTRPWTPRRKVLSPHPQSALVFDGASTLSAVSLASLRFFPMHLQHHLTSSARRLAVLFKGILSPVRRRNPNFYDWNLVVPLYCDGGGYAGRAGWKKVNDSTAIFMDGWRIMKAVLSGVWGLNSATQVLLSGCSAGGQAVVMLCDQVETLLPSATVKCLMDGGFFLDARDRNDNLRFRSLVKRVTSLHQATGNARCGRAHEDEEKWRCFFPQYALGYIASTVYVVNPLFDYAALSIGNQLPNKTSSIARCLHDITVDMPSLTESIRNNSWTTMEFKENSPCTENEQKAVVTVAGTMYNEVKALVKKEPRVGYNEQAFHFPYESERERGVIAVGVMAAALATVSKAKDGSHVSLDGVRDKNVGQLRKLNAAMFPVKYQEKYYSDAMAAGEYTKLAFYSDVHVGAVACRLEREVGSGGGVKVYIMTLGVLAPYRRLGIGSLLLQHVLSQCEAEGSGVREVYLHVQTNNEDAIAFYSRFGFAITDTIKNYYRRLQPPDCYVLSRSFGPGAGATAATLQNGTAAAPGQ
ncbi:unnamed protein product [Closterium sp. NIES-64]|nr:unnamed protein product [Closterium sp. NIES-64]